MATAVFYFYSVGSAFPDCNLNRCQVAVNAFLYANLIGR